MEEPEDILRRIMEFERMCTPKLTNLIKQSLAEEVNGGHSLMDDDTEVDRLPNLPMTTDPRIPSPHHSNLQNHTIHSSHIPNHQNHRPAHRHRETPIMARPGSKPRTKQINPNDFVLPDDLQYHSPDDDDNDSDHHSDDLLESSEEEDPLIEEYKSVSFEIHRAKLRLRKLDRKMTLASRSGESQSDLVKEHSDFKIKIAALISQRRSLESHDVVREHIKSEEDEEDENEIPAIQELPDMDFGMMEIDEDKEEEDEEDEEDEVKTNNLSPINRSVEMGMVDEDTLSKYIDGIQTDDHSRTSSSTINQYEVNKGDAEPEDEEPTGSVQFHSSAENSDEDESGGGGSVQYHSSADENDSDGGGSMVINGDAEEWDTAQIVDYEDGNSSASGGSVQLNDVDHTESWINDEFDAKEMPLTDDHDDADNENEDEKQTEFTDLNRRRHREQISELERPFTVNELVRKNSNENQEALNDGDFGGFGLDPFLKERTQEIDDDDEYKVDHQYQVDEEDEIETPALPERKRKSLILDITKMSQLAAVIEEENSEEDGEGCFEAVEYETDSDADSNDSVVVKKEIIHQVTSEELQKFDGNDDDEEEPDDEEEDSLVVEV